MTTDQSQRIVGIQIPKERAARVLHSLGITRSMREPAEIFTAILDEGDEVILTANLTLKPGSIHGEPAVELGGADPYKFADLREPGLLNEQINWNQRFFVPTDEDKGIAILAELLTRHPVIAEEDAPEEADEAQPLSADDATYNSTLNVVDIDQRIIDVAANRAEPTGKTPEQVISKPEISPDTHTESETDVVPEQEPCTLPAEQSATLQEPFELTAGPMPLPRPALGPKAPRMIEEQLAFDFSAI